MILKRSKCLLQYLLPKHLLSRLIAILANCRIAVIKNGLIKLAIKHYKIDLSVAVTQDLNDYPTFNAFFTRALRPDARPIASSTKVLISPADGNISQLGTIVDGQLLQAKGHQFSAAALIGDPSRAEYYRKGSFITVYLSPRDYHRVHMPIAGQLLQTIYIPGALFSVNSKSVQNIPNLFARNERLVCFFKTSVGEMALILVGAMLVAGIETIWDPTCTRSRKILIKDWQAQNISLDKGAEMGRFKFGSTVIALFGADKIKFLYELYEHQHLKMGEAIATIQEGSD